MRYYLVICLLLWIVSCGEKPETPKNIRISKTEFDSSSVKVNIKYSRVERELINAYVKRLGYPMTETGTGVMYYVYKAGNGRVPQSEDVVLLDFEVRLLNGKICYTSDESGSEEFVVDFDNVESGLHEMMKYLHEGDKVLVIIPPHRAFGLAGDLSMIPPYSTVVYKLHLLKVHHRENKKFK